ncbi:hypothetical protein TI05_16535 [Achromatium sp. WMS3]|nr:hypothetical protein TI05_16535 [Achromatium sp. WMS3]
METFGFEQFESLFRRPDIIKARLAGDLTAGTPAPKLTRPPRVTLLNTRSFTTVNTDQANYPLALNVASRDGVDAKTLRIFVNGKPTLEQAISQPQQRFDLQVPLFNGPNRITAVAYDTKGFSSNQASVDVVANVPNMKKPTLYVMAVGISEYPKMPAESLEFAHTDAQHLVQALRQQRGKMFADVRDYTLTNKEATPQAITKGLNVLAQMDANDIAVIFFAGHGAQDKNGKFWYVTQEGTLANPQPGGLDWQTLGNYLNRIKGRTILFLDACRSGSITNQTVVPNDELAAKFFSGGTGGVMVFSASKGRQSALESPDIGNGAGFFTHYITQALSAKSKEADRNNNGFVEFMELVDYVSKTVNTESAGQQTPWLSRRELFGDLAIARVQ